MTPFLHLHFYALQRLSRRLISLSRPLGGLLGLAALSFLLARAPLTPLLSALLAIGGVLALLLKPSLGLYPLAFAVPFGSLREVSIGGLTIGASELLVSSVIIAWMLRNLAFRRLAVTRSGLRWALLLYLALLCLPLPRAQSLMSAIKELVKWIEFTVLYLFVASELAPQERYGVLAALLLAGITQASLGIYQFLRQVGPPGFILFGRFMRAHGTFLQPNPYGGYLGLLLPLGYVLALGMAWPVSRPSISRSGVRDRLLWMLAIVASGVMSIGLLMSWSRGALLGLLTGAVLVAWAWGGRGWLFLGGAVVLLLFFGPGLLIALPDSALARFGDLTNYVGRDLTTIEITDDNFAIVERLAHWQAAWRMFAQHPWLGVGPGQYAVVYPSVAIPRWQDPLGHAHNYYLHLLAEGGLIGLASYVGLLAVALFTLWRRAQGGTGWSRLLALGAVGTLGHLLGHSLVDNLYVHELYLLLAVILGLALATRSGKLAQQL